MKHELSQIEYSCKIHREKVVKKTFYHGEKSLLPKKKVVKKNQLITNWYLK
jgi:transposase